MHTPTPWKTWTSMNDGSINISNERKEYVALLGIPGEVTEQRIQADAALIVKAVNAYEAMREALEKVLSCLSPEDNDVMAQAVRKALALAEGKE